MVRTEREGETRVVWINCGIRALSFALKFWVSFLTFPFLRHTAHKLSRFPSCDRRLFKPMIYQTQKKAQYESNRHTTARHVRLELHGKLIASDNSVFTLYSNQLMLDSV